MLDVVVRQLAGEERGVVSRAALEPVGPPSATAAENVVAAAADQSVVAQRAIEVSAVVAGMDDIVAARTDDVVEGDEVGIRVSRRAEGLAFVDPDRRRHLVVAGIANRLFDVDAVAVIAAAVEVDVAVGRGDAYLVADRGVPGSKQHAVAHAAILQAAELTVVALPQLVGVAVAVTALVEAAAGRDLLHIEIQRAAEFERDRGAIDDGDIFHCRAHRGVELHRVIAG